MKHIVAGLFEWKFRDAEARFSELFDLAVRGAPQVVARSRKDAVVVVSRADYDALRRRKESFVQFLMDSPLAGSGLVIDRSEELLCESDLCS